MEEIRMELDPRELGMRLERARREQHLTRDDLAGMCNITTVHLRHMEGGTRLPSLPVFILLCNALKVSPTYFLGDYLQLHGGMPDCYERIQRLLIDAPPRQAEMIVAMLETMAEHLQR